MATRRRGGNHTAILEWCGGKYSIRITGYGGCCALDDWEEREIDGYIKGVEAAAKVMDEMEKEINELRARAVAAECEP